MNTKQLFDEILAALGSVRDNKEKLEKLHKYIFDEIYEEVVEEEEEEKIPEKYQKAVSDIAGSLLAGYICYFNPDTLEVEDIPKGVIDDPLEFEMQTGFTPDDMAGKHGEWKTCIEIEPMESRESFKVMEYFADDMEDIDFRNKLIHALTNRKPFANFKYLVDNSEYRQDWFDFRDKQWETYVWDNISFTGNREQGTMSREQ